MEDDKDDRFCYNGANKSLCSCTLKRKGRDAAIMLKIIWFDDEAVALDLPMGINGTQKSHLKLLVHASIWKPS
uniref:Uncharacterized protein n=1 Tax=Oryza brachyantha TaxID=4533 RepID=J3KZ18_ORYBR